MRDAHRGWRAACGAALAVWALVATCAAPASAGEIARRLGGHISLGYSKLVISHDAPGGSLSVAGGMDYPLATNLRLGADVSYSMLGSTTVEQDIQLANLDYSLFEIGLLAHWSPAGLGPVARISLGPTVARANAALSTAGGSLAFSKYAIEEVVPGAALDVTLMKRSSHSPVLAGLEFGTHLAFVSDETWTVFNARLAIHY